MPVVFKPADLKDSALKELARSLKIDANRNRDDVQQDIESQHPHVQIISSTIFLPGQTPSAAAPPATAPSSEHDKLLRTEIIESEKTQADFLKWKLISVAGVASVALGISAAAGALGGTLMYLLCLVPLICLYVDLISLHLMIRIITIGLYLRFSGNRYEEFTFDVRGRSTTDPFVFEAFALHGSSAVFNVILIVLGFVLGGPGAPPQLQAAYLCAGGLGLGAAIVAWFLYGSRARELQRVAETILCPPPSTGS
jgi:hypothetical protein